MGSLGPSLASHIARQPIALNHPDDDLPVNSIDADRILHLERHKNPPPVLHQLHRMRPGVMIQKGQNQPRACREGIQGSRGSDLP